MDKFEQTKQQIKQITKQINKEESPIIYTNNYVNIKDFSFGEKQDFYTQIIIQLKRAYKEYTNEMEKIEIQQEDALKQLDTLRKQQQGLLKAIEIVGKIK